MAVEMLLNIPGVKGESMVSGHSDEIDVMSMSWGMSHSGTAQVGGGNSGGKADVHDLSVTKFIDAASPNLMLHCCTAKHFAEIVLTMRKMGEQPMDYCVFTLTDTIITSVQTGGSNHGDQMTESVSFNFAKWKVEYKTQTASGKAGATISAEYSVEENK